MAAMTTTAMATAISSFSSLSLRPFPSLFPTSLTFKPKPPQPLSLAHSSPSDSVPNLDAGPTTDEEDEVEDIGSDPYFDEMPPETEEEIAAAYEKIYGPAYSGISVLGNDPTPKKKKAGPTTSGLGRKRREKATDGFEERVVQVRRVTKVVKGGKKMSFRAVVVVGDKQGKVGVGVGKAKEVVDAIVKSSANARRNIIAVPMTKYSTFPHRYKFLNFGRRELFGIECLSGHDA